MKTITECDKLKVTDGGDFGATQLKALANGTDPKDAVTLEQLQAVAVGQGWNSATFDTANGDLKFFIDAAENFVVSLNGRYQTEAEVLALIAGGSQTNFKISLGAGGSVQERIDNAIYVPPGWSLISQGLNLVITHNTGRQIADATVWIESAIPGYFQKLLNTAAMAGLIADPNNVTVVSLATIDKPINVYLIFGE